ncbi:GAP family protein [Cellulomonas sp. zg-ZUI168]|nr:GAP family protein [Cellulomonas fengjieae]
MDWSRVVAGAALIVLGVRKWVARPRRGEAVETPAWMASLEDASTGRALGLGLLLSGANPKNIVLIGSAMAAAPPTALDQTRSRNARCAASSAAASSAIPG